MTAIEWTDETWNPTTGCSKVSPGCDHCYAETLSLRYGWSKKPWTVANEAENIILHPKRLEKPMKWREPRMVFVNSMSDLFHDHIPDSYVAEVFEVMLATPQHTYQVLTKRPGRMAQWLDLYSPLYDNVPNVWLGVSIESWRFNWRADVLRRIPATVRFISAEPLLDTLYPRNERDLDLTGIDWLIAGGESGNGHRPVDLDWVRQLRDACECPLCGWARSEDCDFCSTRLYRPPAFFFKQWGGRTPKAGGRVLDGRTWDEMPAPAALAGAPLPVSSETEEL